MMNLFSTYYRKLVSLILILSIVPISLIGAYLYVDKISSETDSLKNRLSSLSGIGAHDVNQWIDDRKINVDAMAHNQLIISNTKQLAESEYMSKKYFDAKFALEKQAAISLNDYDWLMEVIISDANSDNIIFHTGHSKPQFLLNYPNHLKDAINNGVSVSDVFKSNNVIRNEFGSYDTNVPTFLISVPIKGEVGVEGVLTARIDVFKMNPRLLEFITDYENIDAYIVNSEGYFLSPSNYSELIDNLVEKRSELELRQIEPKTDKLTEIFSNARETGTYLNLSGYNNYLGNNVVGSISPINENGWKFIVEIDRNEAFKPIIFLQIISTSGILLTILSVIGGSVYFSRRLIEPIKSLQSATLKIKKGDYNSLIPISTSDEIGRLGESFNEMVTSLREMQLLNASIVKKYQDLYETSPGLNRTINLEGIIIDCNQSYADEFGCTKDDVFGKSIFDFVADESISDMHESFDSWRETGTVSNKEIVFQRKDGTKFPGLLSAANLYDDDGYLIGSNTVIRNIEDVKSAQKEIEELRLKRLSVIGELTARIAHDMRNPLSILKNTVEMLVIKRKDRIDNEEQSQWERVQRAIDRMNHQVEDVLDYLRITPTQKTNYSLSDLFKDSTDRLRFPEFITINPPTNNFLVYCDPEKIKVVLVNLIMNAVQAMAGKKGEISVSGFEDDKRNAIIEVSDTGPGITPELISKIFDPLFTTRQVGTGLGLPSCKNIVERHGGKISVRSVVGTGTTFTIVLPPSPPELSNEEKIDGILTN